MSGLNCMLLLGSGQDLTLILRLSFPQTEDRKSPETSSVQIPSCPTITTFLRPEFPAPPAPRILVKDSPVLGPVFCLHSVNHGPNPWACRMQNLPTRFESGVLDLPSTMVPGHVEG